MGKQRYPWGNTKTAYLCCSHEGHIGNLLGRWIFVDMGITDKKGLCWQNDRIHGRKDLCLLAQADNILDMLQLGVKAGAHPTNQGIYISAPHEHGADNGVVLAYLRLGDVGGNSLAAFEFEIALPGFVKTIVIFRIDDFNINTGLETQPIAFDTHINNARAANQNGVG